MAEQWKSGRSQNDRVTGASDEEIRGIVNEEDDEFEDAEDVDEEEDEEESSTL